MAAKKTQAQQIWKASSKRKHIEVPPWISLTRLLDEHAPAVLALAASNENLQVINGLSQRTLAIEGTLEDKYSIASAIKLLEDVAIAENDIGPDDIDLDERVEIEGHPLDKFGWPENCLPDLESIYPHHNAIPIQKQVAVIGSLVPKSWMVNAQFIAKNYILSQVNQDLYPTQRQVSEHVAKEMRKHNIHSTNGPLGEASILRQALQGKWWSVNKPSKRR